MDIYVLDRDFNILGLCDNYKSIIWSTRYFEIGDFELYLPAIDDNILLLKEDLYVVRDKDIILDGSKVIYENVMVIERIQITTSVEDGNYLIVTGRCLKSLLSRRIVWYQTTLTGKFENVIRNIINENAINPSIAARKIDKLILGTAIGITERVSRQVTGDNLASFIIELCTAYGVGWDIYIYDGNFVFILYKGVDRSYRQSENPRVEFSPEYDNLNTSDYQFDKTNYKNVALVAGEGEGLNRKTVTVGNASGLDRYEMYVDSRNSSTNDGKISETEYNNLLAEEGNETLSEDENKIIENIEGQIEPHGNYTFNVDYFLGDVVEVINEYGIETTPRIIEVIESEDDTGSSTIPTFSTWEV